MRILRVVSDLYPEVVGGLGIHVHEMSKEQAKNNEVTVYTANHGNSKKTETRDGYRIERFRDVRIMGNSISPSLMYKLFVNRKKFDIIHAHSHLFFSTFICALIRHFGSAPLVVTNHGLISQTVPTWFNNLYNSTVAKWIFNSADAVLCYTEEEKEEIVQWGVSPGKIIIIKNGINTELFIPASEKSDETQLLWIGRFIPGKAVEYLIDAFEIVLKEKKDVRLSLVGRGPLEGSVRKQIQDLDLDDEIEIKDYVPNAEICELYQKSTIFVLPSLEEGVPRTILEAMSCGLPIICTEIPQLVNLVQDCGIIVPKKDSEALSNAILKILNDKELASLLGENGRKKVINDYSWHKTVKETLKVYGNLLKDS